MQVAPLKLFVSRPPPLLLLPRRGYFLPGGFQNAAGWGSSGLLSESGSSAVIPGLQLDD